ncbi:MAG: amidohydrolase [Bacillota bacterium]|jgi:predicted amidohydrolase YtcJ
MPDGKSDLLLTNARLVTFAQDPFSDRGDAVAVKDGLIQAVGSRDELEGLQGLGTRVIDLEGAVVLPGFIDTHVHLVQTGLQMLSIDLVNADSIPGLLEKLAREAREFRGNFIMAYFDEMNLEEKGFPTQEQLDQAAPGRLLKITQLSGHLSLTNGATFRWLDLDPSTPGIGRNEAGEFSGVLRAEANHTFSRVANARLVSEEQREESVSLAVKECLRQGVTTVHALEGGGFFGDIDSDFIYKNKDACEIDLILWDQTTDVDRVLERGLGRIGGCLTADGSIEAYTAAVSSPYTDGTHGSLYYSDEEMEHFVTKAHRAGLQIAIHCDGDRAVEQVLRAYERALRECPRYDHRHRIEHAEVITHEQIRRIARLGVHVAMQPSHLRTFGSKYEEHLGAETMNRVHLYNTMLRAGIRLAGGSDAFVSPINPLFDIQSAVNHRSLPTESLTVYDAMRLYTVEASRFGFEEIQKGSMETGKQADLVVLDLDPRSVHPKAIDSIKVLRTFARGVERYSL